MREAVSVVVPTRNRPAMLERCLASLAQDLGEGDEVIVVDSASADPVAVAAVAQRYGVRLTRCERAGASLARNTGWRLALHDPVAFVDDDVRVHPGWAAALVAAFDDPAVSFVSGRIVLPEGQQEADRPVAVSHRTEPEALHAGLSGDLGASANLAVRRAALDAVGGFDETVGPGTWAASAEDLDLLDRLFREGLTGWFEPAAIVEHDQWRSRLQLIRLDWGYGKGMGVRLARLGCWDRKRARRLFREAVIDQGLRPVLDDLRNGYEFGAMTVATRTLATLLGLTVGTVWAWVRPVAAAHGSGRAKGRTS
jgi:glycosyltransferase involved in cell wall biosynthesis